MSRVEACLRALGRGMVHGLAANGWCWAACTLGAFPIEAALAAHGGRGRVDERPGNERDPRPDLSDETPVRSPVSGPGHAWT